MSNLTSKTILTSLTEVSEHLDTIFGRGGWFTIDNKFGKGFFDSTGQNIGFWATSIQKARIEYTVSFS